MPTVESFLLSNIVGIVVLVLGISFMFRALGWLRTISEGVDGVRVSLEQSRMDALRAKAQETPRDRPPIGRIELTVTPPPPLHPDPEIAAYLRLKKARAGSTRSHLP